MFYGLKALLSEENIKLHEEYLENLRLRYSVYEACDRAIIGKNMRELNSMRLGSEKREILELKSSIMCHELFFNSFAEPYRPSKKIREEYCSEANFLYEVYSKGRNMDCGYIILYERKGNLGVFTGAEVFEVFLKASPLLCIDMYEHAYFHDYRFEKAIYLEKALSFWNLTKTDNP